MKNLITTLLAAGIVFAAAKQTRATPYASGLTNNAGTVSFYLNEDAQDVRIILNNGAGGTNIMGGLARGKWSFSLGTNTTYSIQVSKPSGAGYKSSNGSGGAVKLQISESTNRYLNFENPRAIRINQNPSSRYFGRIYTANTRTNATSSNSLVRQMGVGIYMINPDQTSAHPAGQEDSPLRPANWPLTLNTSSSGYTFPYGLFIGEDDNVYAADWTDTSGNLWVTDAEAADPGSAVLLGLTGSALLPVGVNNTHGSINAAWVDGSVLASNLVAWTIDEDLQTNKTTTTPTQLNGLWRYDITTNSLPYQLDGTNVWFATGKQGIATSAQTCDMTRSTNGNFFIVMARSAGNESGLAIVSPTGTPIWNSWDASQLIRPGTDLITNTFRVAISRDEKYVAVARTTGLVWIMPLINGLPDLTNRLALQPFDTATRALRGLGFDPAGNLYVSSPAVEYLAVFSPGGTTVATTANNAAGTAGSFNISIPTTSVSVSASVSSITESGGSNGVFTVTRAGDNSTSVTIPYTITGTATSGSDFTALAGSVTLAAFQTSSNIVVTPGNDSNPELTETVIFTLQGGAGYSVGSPGSATVSILDDETPQVSFEQVTAGKLLESYAPSKVTYQLTRRGLLTSALTVNLAYSGSATRGADYNSPATVSLGANAVNANVTLTPINDQQYEGVETAIIIVNTNIGYNPSSAPSNSISATVIDDEYPAGPLLFSDNFDAVSSSNNWIVNIADSANGSVTFTYDYNAVGIPLAPGGGSSNGLAMFCGNNVLQINGISCSPTNGNFTGNYRLKFDMWINYNGPMPDGGPGSTQHFDAGVGTAGDRVVWYNNPDPPTPADGVWFTASGDGADGNVFGDYSAFIGPDNQNDDTGFYAAGTGGPNSGLRNSSHPFYSLWGGHTAPAAQVTLYPNQSGVAFVGNAGMAWHTVVITKVTNTVTWVMDGITIATVTNETLPFGTNVFVGYQDRFSSGTISDVPAMSFGLVDNLRVEGYADAPLMISSIAIVGANVEVTFTASTTALPANFKLQSSGSVIGAYLDDNSAVITQLGSGLFKATTAAGAGPQFFRIKQ